MAEDMSILEGQVATDKMKKELEAWWILKRKSKLMKIAPGLALCSSTLLSMYLQQFDLSYPLHFIIILASAIITICPLLLFDLHRRLTAVVCILQSQHSKTS